MLGRAIINSGDRVSSVIILHSAVGSKVSCLHLLCILRKHHRQNKYLLGFCLVETSNRPCALARCFPMMYEGRREGRRAATPTQLNRNRKWEEEEEEELFSRNTTTLNQFLLLYTLLGCSQCILFMAAGQCLCLQQEGDNH